MEEGKTREKECKLVHKKDKGAKIQHRMSKNLNNQKNLLWHIMKRKNIWEQKMIKSVKKTKRDIMEN